MKKIYAIVILLSFGITQIYAQCYQCNGTNFLIGTGTAASGQNSFAGGNYSTVTNNNGFAFGNYSNVLGLNGIALGNYANVNFADGIALGSYVTSNAANSLVLGMGTSLLSLTNSKPNSIMFGVSNLPTLTIWKPNNADRGYLGIGTDNPTEMAHVVGNLLIESTSETSSSLQFKHSQPTRGDNPGDPPIYMSPYYWDIYSDYHGLKFNTIMQGTGTSSQKMILSHGGRLGIGVATPLEKLHVDQNIIAEGKITTLNSFVLAPDNSGSVYWEISRTGAGLNFAYRNNKLVKDILFIGNGGNIGIGKTNPSTTLDVSGSFKATTATISGALTAQSATIDNTLTTDMLDVVQDVNIGGTTTTDMLDVVQDVNIGGLFSARNARISTLLCAQEILVKNGSSCWPDFVFSKEYKLRPLTELEQFITANQHLPNVPSAEEVKTNGVELGEMNAILLQKVEELTLYIIQMEKRLAELESKKGGE
ncbi:MAG: hypothetical protein LBU83_00995 [Bacteroidales bacterium]|jgi:hypothetical protein|nr:hypothetical protein [Bacteroidales bacterium]